MSAGDAAGKAEASAAPLAAIPLSPSFSWRWTLGIMAALAGVALLGYAVLGLFLYGVGLWGTNIPFVWGFDLINYAWWIGVANGASLFAAMLVLRQHDLRTAVNRFAEGVALFAVICAGIFPIVHLGRPWLFYWTFPYPATFEVWPQFRSTLTWDFWAISTHAIVTVLLWYTGLIPDLATLRDKARSLRAKKIYAIFALGWRGSIRHWLYHQWAYRLMAALVLPLILVMQSVVALEFAVTLVPDWHETRQPLHFVVTGLVQGLATVLMVGALLRRALHLEHHIAAEDLDLLGRLVLASALVSALLYIDEVMLAILSGTASREAVLNRLAGDYAVFFWGAVALIVLAPQLLWSRAARLNAGVAFAVGLSSNIGVWLDRFSIIVGGLQRTRLPFAYDLYWPTTPEWFLLLGTVGLFCLFCLLLVRYLPVVSLYETRHDEHQENTP
jgi:Ni/Fe-hydrogenase subunit HybB-like protein